MKLRGMAVVREIKVIKGGEKVSIRGFLGISVLLSQFMSMRVELLELIFCRRERVGYRILMMGLKVLRWRLIGS
jgi:hypothetical protein